MKLPSDHPQRLALNDEVHARPPEALQTPVRISYLALYADTAEREAAWQAVAALARSLGTTPPAIVSNHVSLDLGAFRLVWERHSEFVRFTFIVAGASAAAPFAEPALAAVPAEWVAALPGRLMVASHTAILKTGRGLHEAEAIATGLFEGNAIVAATIADGHAAAFTDFRIHSDGFSRLLVHDHGLAPREAGRMVQRLLEIDTYRVMALLALPVAQALTPFITGAERELAQITAALVDASDQDEPGLLDRLTRLEAAIDSRAADNHYRFGAAAAYYELVYRRIDELREDRIAGLPTFREFTERRLAPAMNTCRAAASRQDALAERVARGTQLLSTRVDITSERQNQAVLESLNRRALLQLRLQQTVEGLSVAAVTYYVAGLVGFVAKGVNAGGLGLDADLAVALSVPVVAVLMALGVRRLRRSLAPQGE